MNIAYLLDDSLDCQAGVQQYVLTLGNWMQKQGHSVVYIASTTNRTDINVKSLANYISLPFNRNIVCTSIPVSLKKNCFYYRQIMFRCHSCADAIQFFFSGKVVDYASIFSSSSILGTFHISPYNNFVYYTSIVQFFITFWQMRRVQKVYDVSSVAEKFALSRYKLFTKVLPNAIDIDRYRLNINCDTAFGLVNIVFLGRLVKRKGCHLLLAAIKSILYDH